MTTVNHYPENSAQPDFQINREHKSSVFSLLFSKPDILRELYSAIEGVDLPPDIPIDINTLTNALIKETINDISFLIDKRLVVLIEHQSTINENMALRILRYIDEIFRRIVDHKKTFGRKLIKIPTPEFIVLYNGEEPYPDKSELRLSDAFMDTSNLISGPEREKKVSLELVVQVYNINHGHNPEIQQKCETLNNYSLLIEKIREYQKTGLTLASSIESAVKYCVGNNLLGDFLKEHGSMISDILFHEYNLDDHLDAHYQDGVEDGIEKGIELGEQKNQKYVLELIAQGLTSEEIKLRLEQKNPEGDASR